MRVSCNAVVAVLAALISLTVAPPRAATLQFDLTITYLIPPDPILPAGNLTGTPQFYTDNGVIDHLLTVATPPSPILPLGQTYFASFIPTDPCFGQASCAISFSFVGLTQGFPAGAFQTGNVPNSMPTSPPLLLIAVLAPTDPCAPGDLCHGSGSIVAFDDPIVIGSWDIGIHAVPTPIVGAGLPGMLSVGAACLAAWWRRKRKGNS